MMKKRYLALLLVLVLALVACNPEATGDATEAPATVAGEAEVTEAADTGDTEATEETEGDETEPAGEGTGSDLKVGMVTDEGGVNDQSFNQSAWEGMERAEEELGVGVSYVESHNESDYAPNFDTSLEQGNQLIWGIGFMLTDALNAAAEANPETNYALVDSVAAEGLNNAVSVLFKAEQPSFLVGYIAAHMTESNNVGFIGGVEGDIIWGFEYGYRAGVAYGAKELGKEIEVQVQNRKRARLRRKSIQSVKSDTQTGGTTPPVFLSAGYDLHGNILRISQMRKQNHQVYILFFQIRGPLSGFFDSVGKIRPFPEFFRHILLNNIGCNANYADTQSIGFKNPKRFKQKLLRILPIYIGRQHRILQHLLQLQQMLWRIGRIPVKSHGIDPQRMQIRDHHLPFGLHGLIRPVKGVAIIQYKQAVGVFRLKLRYLCHHAGKAAQFFYSETPAGIAHIFLRQQIGMGVINLYNSDRCHPYPSCPCLTQFLIITTFHHTKKRPVCRKTCRAYGSFIHRIADLLFDTTKHIF
jgi:basic membrane lipoprotein Med (substrate-binding protein (PBP1-ABC) superfamily)